MIIKINTGIPEGKKERTNPSANKPSFLVLAHRQVRQMSDVRSVSTIGNYKTALRSLERFLTIEGMNQASLTRPQWRSSAAWQYLRRACPSHKD